jgi:hypothetical protein
MPAQLAQQEDENNSPPTEGMSDTPWVADRGGSRARKAFPIWNPPHAPIACILRWTPAPSEGIFWRDGQIICRL